MNKKVFIIEDEPKIREILIDYFNNDGYDTYYAEDGVKAMNLLLDIKDELDLIILDIMLPKLDGWVICKKVRSISNIPIIMLTAREDEDDKLLGFELGADDYVTKPFSPKVLLARSNTLLKRVNNKVNKDDNIIKEGCFEVNKISRTILMNKQYLDLAPKEYDLLLYFLKNKNVVLTRDQILNIVWGYDYFGDERVVDTHIKKLRKKLQDNSNCIKTIIKVGYKFEVLE